MAKESSFDIVSKVEFPEVQNAIQMTLKEIGTRYDFKGSKSDVTLEKEELVLISDDEFKLNQLKDVLSGKLIKRDVPTKNIEYGKIENASGARCASARSLYRALIKTTPKNQRCD